jgi:two-component system chemotaxis sensor kinase CheA
MEIDRELLLESFLEETGELLSEMEEALLALEERPREEVLHAIFRCAHSLKGLGASLGFSVLTDFAHELEDVLEALLERRRSVTGELVTLLLKAVDQQRALVTASVAGLERMPPDARRLLELLKGEGAEPGEAALEGPEEARGAGTARHGRTLRVDVEKLDRVVTLVGELAIARGQVAQVLSSHGGKREVALAVHQEADRLFQELQEEVVRMRMVPVGPLFRQHQRTVRDLVRAQHKQARLVLEGEDVEVDTALVEGLREPLLHLVRNAVDHGLESPEERQAAGKDPCGRLVLRAFLETGTVVVQLADDGRGLRLERLRQKALALGMAAERLSEAELVALVFEPGLSTAEVVTEVSGRGVGMDVVRREVEAMRGTVELHSEEGRGTTVTLRLPLTLATIHGFTVGVGEEKFVLPLETVRECLALPAELCGQSGGGVLRLRDRALPYLRLRDFLGVPGHPSAREHVLVLQQGERRLGLVVEELWGEGQAILKPLGRLFRTPPGISGSTLLGDGRVGLILDVPTLLRATGPVPPRESAHLNRTHVPLPARTGSTP